MVRLFVLLLRECGGEVNCVFFLVMGFNRWFEKLKRMGFWWDFYVLGFCFILEVIDEEIKYIIRVLFDGNLIEFKEIVLWIFYEIVFGIMMFYLFFFYWVLCLVEE